MSQMFADLRCSPTCARAGIHGTVSICPPECFRYKGTLDVLYKIVQQVCGYACHVLSCSWEAVLESKLMLLDVN